MPTPAARTTTIIRVFLLFPVLGSSVTSPRLIHSHGAKLSEYYMGMDNSYTRLGINLACNNGKHNHRISRNYNIFWDMGMGEFISWVMHSRTIFVLYGGEILMGINV